MKKNDADWWSDDPKWTPKWATSVGYRSWFVSFIFLYNNYKFWDLQFCRESVTSLILCKIANLRTCNYYTGKWSKRSSSADSIRLVAARRWNRKPYQFSQFNSVQLFTQKSFVSFIFLYNNYKPAGHAQIPPSYGPRIRWGLGFEACLVMSFWLVHQWQRQQRWRPAGRIAYPFNSV